MSKQRQFLWMLVILVVVVGGGGLTGVILIQRHQNTLDHRTCVRTVSVNFAPELCDTSLTSQNELMSEFHECKTGSPVGVQPCETAIVTAVMARQGLTLTGQKIGG